MTGYSICVFCGASSNVDIAYHDLAREVGDALAARGARMIFGGGSTGLMGTIADRMLKLECEVIGVIPKRLAAREVAHQHLTQLHVVDSMHERKALMANQADAFLALPGGIGTLEELLEVMTWQQLGYHQKPVGILNKAGFFQPLLAMFQHMVTTKFYARSNLDQIIIEDSPAELVDRLQRSARQGNI